MQGHAVFVTALLESVGQISMPYDTKNLEGENFRETVHSKNWWTTFKQMPKIVKAI